MSDLLPNWPLLTAFLVASVVLAGLASRPRSLEIKVPNKSATDTMLQANVARRSAALIR